MKKSELSALQKSFLVLVGGILTALIISALMMSAAGCTTQHASLTKPDLRFSVDSCLYLGFRKGDRFAFTHAGNCTNPIHRRIAPDTVYASETISETNHERKP